MVRSDEGDGGQDIHLKKGESDPTASASMLVASARGSMERKEKEQSTSSLSSRDSRTMLIPMMDKRRKAIQWIHCGDEGLELDAEQPAKQRHHGLKASEIETAGEIMDRAKMTS